MFLFCLQLTNSSLRVFKMIKTKQYYHHHFSLVILNSYLVFFITYISHHFQVIRESKELFAHWFVILEEFPLFYKFLILNFAYWLISLITLFLMSQSEYVVGLSDWFKWCFHRKALRAKKFYFLRRSDSTLYCRSTELRNLSAASTTATKHSVATIYSMKCYH